MKTLIKTFKWSFAVLLIIITACSSKDDSSAQQRTFEDIATDFQNLDLQPGVNDVTLKNTAGNTWYFRVIIPESAVTSLRPLIITLHGASGGSPDAHKTTACYAEPGFEDLDPIIISPNGGTTQWYEPYNQDMVLSLTYLAREYLQVDEDKIVINGYSNGGNASWYFAETQPDFFSAAVPMASSYNTFNTSGNPRYIATPIYAIHGEDDELFPLEQTQEWVNATKSAGSNVTLEIASGLTHNEPCEYVPYLKHAVQWLQNEVWN